MGDIGFDNEGNHVGAQMLWADKIIPTRHTDVLIGRTSDKYRNEIKRNYAVELYHQRNKS